MTEHNHIRCEEVIAHLLAYLDGEIDDKKREQIDNHLQDCRACFSRAEFERVLRKRVEAAGETKAGAKLRQRIEELIDKF
jgi:anti-sigma factor (TIGR02949 family)